MQCHEIESLVMRRLGGRLDGDAAAQLDRHLDECVSCRDTLDAQRAVAGVLAARPAAEVPLGFTTRVMAELEAVPGWLDLINWRIWTVRLAPVAAALVVVAVLGFGPTEAAAPIEFSDLVTEWVADEETGAAPPFSVLWQDEVTDETLLEAVLTASSGAGR